MRVHTRLSDTVDMSPASGPATEARLGFRQGAMARVGDDPYLGVGALESQSRSLAPSGLGLDTGPVPQASCGRTGWSRAEAMVAFLAWDNFGPASAMWGPELPEGWKGSRV